MHRRLVYIDLLNVLSFSSRYFNKIKRTSRLGRLLALSPEILHKNLHWMVGNFLTLWPIATSLMQMKCRLQHLSVQYEFGF